MIFWLEMMSLQSWLKHAFAVESNPRPPSEKERLVIERICGEVVRRQLVTPAITFLEMSRPLNYLGSQTMQFFLPMVSAIADAEDYATFAKFLERRESIDILQQTIETMSQQSDIPSPLKQPHQTDANQ